MKKTFTKLFAALALLAFFIPSIIAVGQTRADVVLSTCRFGSDYNANNSGYTGTFTVTNGGYTWTVGNGNNNNNGWTNDDGYGQVKFGRKNNASVGYITTNAQYSSAVTKVDVTIDALTASKINSIKLYTSSDNSTWTEAGSFTKATGLQSVSLSSPAANLYYKVEFDCASGSSNGLITVSKVEYYIAGATPTCVQPTFSVAAGAYTSAQNVTISTTTNGATIYYTTDGTDPTTSSNVYSSAISVSSTTTIKAMAVKNGYDNSSIASATYAIVDHAGTENDPYSVADALAVINAGVGITNVYATGIVKAIPYAYTSNNGITFNMVDNVEDTDFIQAFKCTGTEAPNVVVGDVAVVYGSLTYYNNTTYEFTQGCTLVSLTHPSGTVLDPVFTPAAGGYSGTKAVEITCATEGATIYYTTNGNDPTTSSSVYSSAITVSSNTTIKAIAYLNSNHSEIVTANYQLLTDNNTTIRNVAYALANYPLTGVFVSGIVCTAPTQLYSGGVLTDYISADGEANNTLKVYNGRGMDNVAFESKDDIQVGDIVTIYGNVIDYNNTVELNSGNYLVAFQRPVVESITLSSYAIQATADEADGTLDITYTGLEISDMGDFDIQYYNENGDEDSEPDWIEVLVAEEQGGGYVVSYLIEENEGEARETYFKVFAMGSEDFVYSDMVTVEQAAPTVDYATLPFEWAGGASADLKAITGVSSNVSSSDYSANSHSPYLVKFENDKFIQVKCNEQPGQVTFAVKMIGGTSASTIKVQGSADGEEFTDVQTITVSGSANSIHEYTTSNAFDASHRYVKLLKTAGSNVGVGPITIAQVSSNPSIAVANATVNNVSAEGASGTLDVTYLNIATINASVWFCDEQGTTAASYNWIHTSINASNNVTYTIDANSGEARTAYFKVRQNNTDVYSNIVTISQLAYVAPAATATYSLATSIVSGKQYIIVGENNDSYYAMGHDKGNNRNAVAISVNGTIATAPIAATETDAHEFTITSLGEGYYSIMDATTSGGYLYAGSSSGNQLKTEETLDGNHNGDWAITIEDGSFSISADQSSNRHVMQFNTSGLFNCYSSASQNPVYLYVKDEAPTTYDLTINGYTSDANGWNLIASPVATTPSQVTNMLSNTYDLYRFNQSVEAEWENYKNNTHQSGFTITPGQGYLYANSGTTTTLQFSGELYDGNGIIALSYDADAPHATMKGWNLVGNPYYNETTNIGQAYYRMNSTNSGLISANASENVNPWEGIFVQATAAEQSVTFTKVSKGVKSNNTETVTLNVMRNGNVIDRAIVNLDNSSTLRKFQLFESDTKIYIPQNDADYAIVSSNGQGTMPVNFKAKEMGMYTISVETEGIDLSYLHLIDRLTGEDVNLLIDSKYSFIASNSDMENRFILSFNENGINANGNETFAFQNGNEIIVNGEGELQVFDVMGRMVSNTIVNGVEAIALPQGVYIFRLNENIQKIVVR